MPRGRPKKEVPNENPDCNPASIGCVKRLVRHSLPTGHKVHVKWDFGCGLAAVWLVLGIILGCGMIAFGSNNGAAWAALSPDGHLIVGIFVTIWLVLTLMVWECIRAENPKVTVQHEYRGNLDRGTYIGSTELKKWEPPLCEKPTDPCNATLRK